MLFRAIEDGPEQVTELHVRLMNEQAFQEKYSFMGMRISQFNRLIDLIPDRNLIKFHLNMSMFSFQDTKSIERLFQRLSEFLEV